MRWASESLTKLLLHSSDASTSRLLGSGSVVRYGVSIFQIEVEVGCGLSLVVMFLLAFGP